MYKITIILMLAMMPAMSQANEVRVSSIGQWGNNYQPLTESKDAWEWDAYIWVDVIVENQAFEKEVGLVWTKDNWESFETVFGRYDGRVNRRTELWSIDFKVAPMMTCSVCIEGVELPVVRFAVFYTVDGMTYWDNNNGMNFRQVLRGDFEPLDRVVWTFEGLQDPS